MWPLISTPNKQIISGINREVKNYSEWKGKHIIKMILPRILHSKKICLTFIKHFFTSKQEDLQKSQSLLHLEISTKSPLQKPKKKKNCKTRPPLPPFILQGRRKLRFRHLSSSHPKLKTTKTHLNKK